MLVIVYKFEEGRSCLITYVVDPIRVGIFKSWSSIWKGLVPMGLPRVVSELNRMCFPCIGPMAIMNNLFKLGQPHHHDLPIKLPGTHTQLYCVCVSYFLFESMEFI